MELTDPIAFLKQNPPTRDLSDVFTTDNRSDQLREFVEDSRVVKEQEVPGYYWPCDINPHAAEVMEWQKQHIEELFPNTFRQ
jgi:hypothetical protein